MIDVVAQPNDYKICETMRLCNVNTESGCRAVAAGRMLKASDAVMHAVTQVKDKHGRWWLLNDTECTFVGACPSGDPEKDIHCHATKRKKKHPLVLGDSMEGPDSQLWPIFCLHEG